MNLRRLLTAVAGLLLGLGLRRLRGRGCVLALLVRRLVVLLFVVGGFVMVLLVVVGGFVVVVWLFLVLVGLVVRLVVRLFFVRRHGLPPGSRFRFDGRLRRDGVRVRPSLYFV